MLSPITLEIIANRLDEIQRIMKHRLFRTGYSTILRESFDGGSGLTDHLGRVIGASGMSIHTRPYGCLATAIVETFKDDIHEGDVFISNDPFKGGVAHTSDMAVATPVFAEGHLVAFCASIAHKPDVGGIAPGTASSSSRSIYHEGINIPPVKFYDRGQQVDSVRRILENNSRTPALLLGDLQGQVGCTRIGGQLVRELCQREGVEVVKEAVNLLMASSERRMRDALAAMPDGEAYAENYLDGDGVSDRPVKVAVRVIKQHDTITLDFTGTDAQTEGPANAVTQLVEAAVLSALLSVADHTIANNDGLRQAVRFICPPGTVVNPTHPAPVNSYIPTIHLAYSVVLDALGKLVPDRVPASSGLGMGGITLAYGAKQGGASHVHYEIFPTALGGTPRIDGCPAILPIMNFESIHPIESVESEFPVRISDFSVWTDSGGAGLHRGGMGVRREFELLEPAQFVSRLSQRRFAAHGSAGGQGSPACRTLLKQNDGSEQNLPGLAQVSAPAGTRVELWQTGGAGWGDPRLRSPEAVLRDVEDGYVSIASAERDYGVVIVADPVPRIARLERDDSHENASGRG